MKEIDYSKVDAISPTNTNGTEDGKPNYFNIFYDIENKDKDL